MPEQNKTFSTRRFRWLSFKLYHNYLVHSRHNVDHLGFAFFLFAGLLTLLAAWEWPTVLELLGAIHNLALAVIYMHRLPATSHDRTGLWLGLIAAVLPIPFSPMGLSLLFTLVGIVAYALILWSLLTLRGRFGIAPADRGLATSGPYRFIRHPMYLGELALRFALLAGTGIDASPLQKVLLFAVALGLQIVRLRREERIISGYGDYMTQVQWRLVIGLY